VRTPRPEDLIGRPWWAFGFAEQRGNSASGRVGEVLAYGHIRLDTVSRYPVARGFSGASVWSPDYEAVVGLIGAANARGDGQALTMHAVDQALPAEGLAALAVASARDAGDAALYAWGWRLADDPEGGRHWVPRGRGVTADAEGGYRFRGRAAALETIVRWLGAEEPDQRALVVTGSPGSGKSAILGRIVTTADPVLRAALPPDDEGVRAEPGAVSCAVHAKGKTALEVATELARALSVRMPARLEEFARDARDRLAGRGRPFSVVIDALDEAHSSADARLIARRLVRPLLRECAEHGARVVVGSRRRDAAGDLIASLGPTQLIDLDSAEFFSARDLGDYALASLQAESAPGNPYADPDAAAALAARIAELAKGNFLVAGLTARRLARDDTAVSDPHALRFPDDVGEALRAYLEPLPPVSGLPATTVLQALACAEAPGLPVTLWKTAVAALTPGARISARQLSEFAASAAEFLLETSGAIPAYRLFHQALNDALGASPADHVTLTSAFLAAGQRSRWRDTSPYLLRSLSYHAARGGTVDALLEDAEFLLHADLSRLAPLLDDAVGQHARDRARLLRLTPAAVTAPPGERAAQFAVTEAVEDLGTTYRHRDPVGAYYPKWAVMAPRAERMALLGHAGPVGDVCVVPDAYGRVLLASAASDYRDRTVRIWDAATGLPERVIETGHIQVTCLCTVDSEDRVLLAGGTSQGDILLWDPAIGDQAGILKGHLSDVVALCQLTVDGRAVLVSASGRYPPGRILIHELSGKLVPPEILMEEMVPKLLCPLSGGLLAIAAGADVGIWDLAGGLFLRNLRRDEGDSAIQSMCAFAGPEGLELLAVAREYGFRAEIWDPIQGGFLGGFGESGYGPVNKLCAVPRPDGHDLLVAVGGQEVVQVLGLGKGIAETLHGHLIYANSACAVPDPAGRALVAVSDGSVDATGIVRVWDVTDAEIPQQPYQRREQVLTSGFDRGLGLLLTAAGMLDTSVDVPTDADPAEHRHTTPIQALCTLPGTSGRAVLASGADDDNVIRIWDLDDGVCVQELRSHSGLHALCVLPGGRLAAGGGVGVAKGWIKVWDIASGARSMHVKGLAGTVRALRHYVDRKGRDMITADSALGTWNLADGRQPLRARLFPPQSPIAGVRCELPGLGTASASLDTVYTSFCPPLTGHTSRVLALCPVPLPDDTILLASGGDDRTVRIWRLDTAECAVVIPVHHPVRALVSADGILAVGTVAGLMAIEISL
jgi:WD40 repeat protein